MGSPESTDLSPEKRAGRSTILVTLGLEQTVDEFRLELDKRIDDIAIKKVVGVLESHWRETLSELKPQLKDYEHGIFLLHIHSTGAEKIVLTMVQLMQQLPSLDIVFYEGEWGSGRSKPAYEISQVHRVK